MHRGSILRPLAGFIYVNCEKVHLYSMSLPSQMDIVIEK